MSAKNPQKDPGNNKAFPTEVRELLADLGLPDVTDDQGVPSAHQAGSTEPIEKRETARQSQETTIAQYPFLSLPQAADEIGRLGTYRILGLLGSGGMGVVFRAEDPALRRQVALKVMLPHYASNQTFKTRFLREARAQATVEHDHVISIHQVGEDRGVPFIAMPLLKGETLAAALKGKTRLTVVEAVRIAREIAEGLAAAHASGLIHRDIKPGNVWLEGSKRRVKILDFGLARDAAAEDVEKTETITRTGDVIGTPSYMSPEQAQAEQLDGQTDIFSLGVVLYRMLTGHMPFQGRTTTAILLAVVNHTPPPPSQLNVEVTPELDAVTMRMLAKTPAKRPKNAEAVVEILRQVEADLLSTSVVSVVLMPMEQQAAAADTADPWESLETTNADSRPTDVQSAAATLVIEPSEPVYRKPAPRKPSPQKPNPLAKLPWLPIGAGAAIALVLIVVLGLLVKVGKKKDGAETDGNKEVASSGHETKKKNTPAGTADPDRKASQYILSIGGTIRVNDQDKDITLVSELPQGPTRLTYVSLENNDQVTDTGLASFKDCKNLTLLFLDKTSVSDAGLAYFKDCKNLQFLSCAGCANIGDSGLTYFKDCKNLSGLYLQDTPISDTALFNFKDCKNLAELNLSNCKQIGDAGMANFKGMKNLTDLNLSNTAVTSAGLANFKDSKKLQILWLNSTAVTDEGLAAFKNARSLNNLHADNCKELTGSGLANFKDFNSLARVSLQKTQVNDAALESFKDFKNLNILKLDGCTQIGNAGLAAFKECKNLSNLSLAGCTQIDSAGLVHIKDCPSLRTLILDRTMIDDAGLASLKVCKNLAEITLLETKVTSAGIDELKTGLPQCRIKWDGGVIEPK